MKQVLQSIKSGETMVVDVPVPEPKPGMVLVRTAASLVSAGTERMIVSFAEKSLLGKAKSRPDLVKQVLDKARREGVLTTAEAALNRLDQPMVLGYSSAGTVVELGQGVDAFHVGQRVACGGGGYAVHAEFAVVPVNLVAALPDNVSFEEGAFATLGAIAMHGFRLSNVQIGERVAVIGLGLLGLLTVGIAQAAGVSVLGIDLDEHRVDLAREMGAQAVLRSSAEEAAQSFTHGKGVDAVLICADTPSNDPVNLAGEISRNKGKVVAVGAVGLNIPRKVYYEKELDFVNSRSYGPGRYDSEYEEKGKDYPFAYVRWTEGRNIQSFVDLLAAQKVNVSHLITHRYPIDAAPAAYDLITGKAKEPFLGVLLTYPTSGKQDLSRVITLTGRTKQPALEPVNVVRLGVIGAGNFAQAVMLPAIKSIDGLEKVAIVSASGVNAQHAGKKFDFSYIASEPQQLLSDETINTLAILTRHNLHAEQVVAGIKAGKHVFCEKPLALDIDQLAMVQEALNEAKNMLTVGFNRRFAPLGSKMKHFLDRSVMPMMMHYRVNAGYIPLNHWVHDPEIGGGRIIGEACHFIDFLTFLVGQPPRSVQCVGLPDDGIYREDNVQITLEFPDGSIGVVSYLANGDKSFSKERIEVFKGGRVAVLDDFRRLELIYEGRRQVYQSRLRQDKGHKGIWEGFVAAILNGGDPPIPYDHILGVTMATLAAVTSLRQKDKIYLDDGRPLSVV